MKKWVNYEICSFQELENLLVEGCMDFSWITFAAERYGQECSTSDAERVLLPVLKHEKSAAREGVLYGLRHHVSSQLVKEAVMKLAKDDPSPTIREIAEDTLTYDD